ncbi:hypothetical protein [Endozoicomonas sp. ISHI1]|uniref:hypothetical protein n=1 Tax=Endozoicomonas sp. ISHI1 TaxID=2825882 RepID=UPI0021492DC5|nr:hypothetical protein [Endozoicomonas sp. ISHI1]
MAVCITAERSTGALECRSGPQTASARDGRRHWTNSRQGVDCWAGTVRHRAAGMPGWVGSSQGWPGTRIKRWNTSKNNSGRNPIDDNDIFVRNYFHKQM